MKVYGTGNPKVVRKITHFWQSKELLLLILFLPICCIIVASPGEQGSNEL